MENQYLSKNEEFQFFDIIEKYIKHWLWFLVSVVLCSGIAVLYIKMTPKRYQRTAQVLIIENSQPDISAAFTELNKYRDKVNVNNEIEVFNSPTLSQEVVKRLKLNISYIRKDGLRTDDLYNRSPFTVIFADSVDIGYISFQVELLPDNAIILSDFFARNNKINQHINAKFDEIISTPAGNVIITPTRYYYPDLNQLPVEVTKSNIMNVALSFSSRLTVTLASKLNTVINLDFEDVSIQRAEDFLNTLINVYNEKNLAEKNSESSAALDILNKKIPLIKEELESMDKELAKYKSEHLITDPRNAASQYMQESRSFSAKVGETNTQITIAKYIKDYLKDEDKKSESLPSFGLNNPALEAAIKEYNEKLRERNRLINNGGANNPVVVNMNHELEILRQSIMQTVDNIINNLEMSLKSLQSQENIMIGHIASNPVQEIQLISIEREQNIKESLYLHLLQQREEKEMALTVNTTNSMIIKSPTGEIWPFKPKKKLIMMIAIFFGIAIPFSIIWGKDIIDITVRDKNDLNVLSAPSLGIIPFVNKNYLEKGSLIVREKGQDTYNEAFRLVRTNLNSLCDKDVKVIMITSLESKSGKTFMALNLAMTLALAGKKIVLVDMDMRKALLSKMISFPVNGLSYYLKGTITDENLIIKKDYLHEGFDIIPVGEIPYNPTELLISDKLQEIMENLKNAYDYVILDSTPLEMMADAVIVGEFADLQIFIIREGHTNRRNILNLEEKYKSGQFKKMAYILNGAKNIKIENKFQTFFGEKEENVILLTRTTELPKYLTDGTEHK